MKCNKCGNEYEGKFCSNCGSPSDVNVGQCQPNEIAKKGKYKMGIMALIFCTIGCLGIVGIVIGITALTPNSKKINQVSSETTNNETTTASTVVYNEAKNSVNEALTIPNWNELKDVLGNCCYTLNLKSIDDIKFTAYEEDEYKISGTVDLIVYDGNKKIDFSCMYMVPTESWSIISARNVDNKHLYYIDNSIDYTEDLYDYDTDEITEK